MPAREGAEVFAQTDSGDEKVGVVTSGGFSPTLEQPIAMAYVSADYAHEGKALEIEVRKKRLSAQISPMPFVSHKEQLGDIVFVELPDVGAPLDKAGDAAVVESVKAASDVYAPITGEVTEVNGALEDEPALVNSSPEEEGWFFRMTIGDSTELEGLMDGKAYKAFVDGL